MTKTFRAGVIAVMVLMVPATGAFAAADWLDKFSGPGPFRSYVGLTYRFLCVSNGRDLRTMPGLTASPSAVNDSEGFFTWLHPFEPSAGIISVVDTDKLRSEAVDRSRPLVERIVANQPVMPSEWRPVANRLCRSDERTRGYASVTVRNYKSIENNLFPRDPRNRLYEVRILDTEASYTARVNRGLSVGAGGGIFWFSGDAFDAFHRGTVTPILVEASPFAAAGDRLKYRFLRLYGAYTMVLGQLDGSDFCTRGKCPARPSTFHTSNEFVWRYGIEVDVAAVLQWFIR